MKHSPDQRGREFEALAAQHLCAAGLQILAHRYHCRLGEIDLIGLNGEMLVFVEVRYRKRSHFGDAATSVTPQKQRRIINTARHFLMHHPRFSNHAIRFDVIAVEADSRNAEAAPNVRWIRAAFDAH